MEIRKLHDSSEQLESERVLDTAFLNPWDEAAARGRIEAASTDHVSWGLFDDDGRMSTSISTIRRQLSFGGEAIPVGEVHMVGSLPEHRGGGGVRTLMGEVLRDFQARGDALAVLIPFSCSFYRKFGFEVASRIVCQRVPIEALAGYACDLRATRVWDEDDLAIVRIVYDRYARTHDLMELRGQDAWAWHGKGEFGDPDFLHPERQRYAYVLWDEGEPCAYLRFSFFHEPGLPFVGELQVSDFVFDSPAALRALLGFLYRMRAKVSHVNFELADLDLAMLVPDGDKVEQRIDSHVMARLLDTERLLRLMPQAYGSGSYVLQVEDDFLSEDGGRWRVTYEDGHTSAVEKTDEECDLVVDTTVATQLILGRIGLDEAVLRTDVRLVDNVECLMRTFRRRPVHLTLG